MVHNLAGVMCNRRKAQRQRLAFAGSRTLIGAVAACGIVRNLSYLTWEGFQSNMKCRYLSYFFVPVFCLSLASCGGGSSGPAAEAAAPAPFDATGQLAPDCSGADCGAQNATTYSGSGIGIWRYNNDTGATATLNLNIAGVTAGKVATLVFSNGSQATASAPGAGFLASPVTPSTVLAEPGAASKEVVEPPQHADAHAPMLEKNRAIAAALIRSRSTARPSADLASAAAVSRLTFSPDIGSSRIWYDNFSDTPVSYTAAVQHVCTLPNGRNVVWWTDPAIVSSGKFTADGWSVALVALQASYCGGSGGLARLNSLLGDVWGSAASQHTDVIQDAPALQDVNIVLLNVPESSGWAGYFFAGNNLRKSSFTSSNEALAFFINPDQVKTDLNFAASTLMHESTHMVNFYQRTVARNVIHDTWLEETSAMMTEDIVAPAVVPAGTGGYNKVLSFRLPIYMGTGGNVSYINWLALADASPHYAMGGGFGAFLNRRYGLTLYQQLVTTCNDGVSATATAAALTSYGCLDGLIKTNGGIGFRDEFARFGASVFGQLPAVGTPAGYGYPAIIAGAYSLQAKDLFRTALAAPAALSPGFSATSHTYQRDTIAAGKSSYVRNGVVVPANTSLSVIIK